MNDRDPNLHIKPSTAIGYSVTANLGDRRQIVIQHFVGDDEPDAVANANMDRIMGFVDRLQARYDIEAEMEGFDKVGMTLAHTIDALPTAERNAAKQKVELAAKLEGLREDRKAIFDEGYAEHTSKGGRGAYQPKGHRANQLAAKDAEIAAAEKALTAVPQDQAQHKQEVLNSIKRFQEDLKQRRKRVNHLLQLLGKPATVAYAQEETFAP